MIDITRNYLGLVVDNEDPKKEGRVRVRVFDVFDSIPIEDIPWASPRRDLNGNAVNIPDKDKIVSVNFEDGNIYTPQFTYSQHYNINLKKKLEELSGDAYTSMKALIFDNKTQIFTNSKDGLMLDHKFNQLNIKEGYINLNLKDNMSKLNLGSEVSQQQSILGNHFLDWFDEFVDQLLQGPFLGNLGAPVVAQPSLIQNLLKYKALKDPKFLSHHVNIVDNEAVTKVERINEAQLGDKLKSTNKVLEKKEKDIYRDPNASRYEPRDGNSTDNPDGPLSTSENENGGVTQNNLNEDDLKVTPTTNDDVQKIVNYITELSKKDSTWQLLTKPYEMNIVGIRRQYEGMKYSDQFKDSIYIIFKDDKGAWQKGGPYRASTIPGLTIKDSIGSVGQKGAKVALKKYKYKSKSDRSLIPRRPYLGTLMEGFYKDIYQVGAHAGDKAMKVVGTQRCYRDQNVDSDIITYSVTDKGNFGMLIHRGFAGGTIVGNWSEGCQIFADKASLDQFFNYVQKHLDKGYKKTFNYALILGKNIGL